MTLLYFTLRKIWDIRYMRNTVSFIGWYAYHLENHSICFYWKSIFFYHVIIRIYLSPIDYKFSSIHAVKIYLLTSNRILKYLNLILQLIDFGAVHMIFCSVVKYIYQEPIQIRPLRTWIFLKTAPQPFWDINLIHTYLDTILGYKPET